MMKLFAVAVAALVASAPVMAEDLNLVGDYTLSTDFDGTINIRDGTLTLNGCRVSGSVYQTGPGSVVLANGAVVDGNISEKDAGGVLLTRGVVIGNIQEFGLGTVTISPLSAVFGTITERFMGSVLNAGLIVGNIYEFGGGFVVVSGRVVGNIEEAWDGDVKIEPTGRVEGNVYEVGQGTVYNRGYVEGDIETD